MNASTVVEDSGRIAVGLRMQPAHSPQREVPKAESPSQQAVSLMVFDSLHRSESPLSEGAKRELNRSSRKGSGIEAFTQQNR
ncbi:hypothetical protein Syncc9902_1174 [Synechococcus sp. CC9902]|nr:hypothetical protein Syncc9902_1174 [Synechococcus sp. CC9902]